MLPCRKQQSVYSGFSPVSSTRGTTTRQKEKMPRKGRTRRRTFRPGIKKNKATSTTVEAGRIFRLIEEYVPDIYLQKFYKLVEKLFNFYTKANCTLCLAPFSLSEDGKLEHCSRKKLWIHYSVLFLLLLSTLHKLVVSITLISSGKLDTSTLMCAATFLFYMVPACVSCSFLILTDETIDLINGWPKILSYYPNEDGAALPLVANSKTAICVFIIAFKAQAVTVCVSGFSFVFRKLPVTMVAVAQDVGLIPVTSGIPRIIWSLVFLPLEFIMIATPLLMVTWGGMILMLFLMVVLNCLNQQR